MNKAPDGASLSPHAAGAQPGTPDAVHSPMPRIEVLRRTAAAFPALGPTKDSKDLRHDDVDGKLPEGWFARNRRPKHGHASEGAAFRRRRPGGLLRSRMMMLVLIAVFAIAVLLLYTYLLNKRDVAGYAAETARISYGRAKADRNPQRDAGAAMTHATDVPPIGASGDYTSSEREGANSSAPRRADVLEARQATVGVPEEPSAYGTDAEGNIGDAGGAVRAFYSALSAGDGTSAAQLVVPAKRQRGPLSAVSLGRYYSSFRRPLRLRSLVPLDANTMQVAYDYVLADGRLCRGVAAVDVVRKEGRELVSRIRTRGPC